MRRQQLSESFLALSAADQLTLTTLRLSSSSGAARALGSCGYFFAYELLDARTLHRNNNSDPLSSFYLQVVSKHALPLQSAPDCVLVASEPVLLLALYERLSQTSFRTDSELVFERLRLSRAETIRVARNPFARMLYHQDVLCLSNLDAEGKFLAQAQQNAAKLARRYRSSNTGDGDDQRALQAYLTGTYLRDTQIYLPPKERQLLFALMRSPPSSPLAKFLEDSMDIEADNSISSLSSEMSSEEEEFLLQLRQELRAKGGPESDYEEKDRSREKERHF